MRTLFQVTFRRSCGNLHIRLQGRFEQMCAWELVKTISQRHRGFERVFVRTDGLISVDTCGISLFKKHMTSGIMPLSNLYLKGEKGFSIAPDGARVLICSRKPSERRPCRKSSGPAGSGSWPGGKLRAVPGRASAQGPPPLRRVSAGREIQPAAPAKRDRGKNP